MRYLNKVVFINSANVPYSEIALDGNVHFIGTQGVGKSTLLRAILFFYNADKLRLGIEKGKKTFDEYYFPYGNSYLVYEVNRDSSSYCILAMKSQGRVCFRFINTAFDKNTFIAQDLKVKSWDAVRDSLGKKAFYSRKIDSYEEYRDVLYGNNAGFDKEFRKYALLESRQYQNIPRTIQNVFLNSKLDAEFIKQTIIMSINEEEIRIELDKYALHLRDFDTELADINKWTEKNKSGEIPVRKMAENISRLHTAILSLNREKQEAAIRLFRAHEASLTELPRQERQFVIQEDLLRTAREKADDLKHKFQLRRDDIQKQINNLEYELKRAKQKNEDYERKGILFVISRVERKDITEATRERLSRERELLTSRFTEINARYDALIQQLSNTLATLEIAHESRKNRLNTELLQIRTEFADQFQKDKAGIELQHKADLEVADNLIAGRKEAIHDLKLRRQSALLRRYYEAEIEEVRAEIDNLHLKINKTEMAVADHKKQVETLQKQWDLENEKNAAAYDRRVDKLREEGKIYTDGVSTITEKLKTGKDSLYGWLNEHMPGWEQNVGKVIDEDRVLFHRGLSPALATDGDTIFGLKIDLEELRTTVKTVAEYEEERKQLLNKSDANRNQVNALIEQRNEESDKMKARYQLKIKDLNSDRKQLEYDLQKAKGQLPANEVKRADLLRKATQEKENNVKQLDRALENASEGLVEEEKSKAAIIAGMLRQVENKEREFRRKEKAETQTVRIAIENLEEDLRTKGQEVRGRLETLKQQQNGDLANEGVDILRLDGLERELEAVKKELEFIENNRDFVAEYRKDKRELLDNVDSYKTDKRIKENQLDNEEEKYSLQKQKLQQEIDEITGILAEFGKKITVLKEGLRAYDDFLLTDNYAQIDGFRDAESEETSSAFAMKPSIDAVNSKIYTLLERYNDLQSAINKFLGNFSSQNIFGFKTALADKSDFISFAEMLYEFLEEDKIVQYEKRVNERFATLIRQIGRETTELTSKGGEIQKVISEINKDFEERNFAGVIKSIRLQLSASQNKIVSLLQEIKQFNDKHAMSLGVVNLFSMGDTEGQNRKAVELLKEFAREINNRKEKEIGLPDSFELQFRIVENENDSGWVEKLTNVGSEGTDILVKAMINIMLLNVFKVSASKRFKDFRLHCMMDEIGKLHPNNVKGILKFANDRNILLINSSPTSYNAADYRYTYLLAKDAKNVTTVKRLIKKGADL